MNPEAIRELYGYNYWAFERVWNCITQLTDDQFIQPIEYSTGAIRNQVVHLMSATHRWMLRLQTAQLPAHLAFEDFTTLASTKARWDELRVDILDYVNALTQDQLDEIIPWELPNRGIVSKNRRWEILLHVANHATDHRAQMLAILNQHFGIQTVEQDMIFYLVEAHFD